MQIAGMAFGLYFTDQLIRPMIFGVPGREGMEMLIWLFKGVVGYWIYKWFQCTSSGTFARHALGSTSFMELLLMGLIGGATLFVAGNLVNERMANDFGSILFRYGIEAVILNFVYGATKNVATNAVSGYGSSSSGSSSSTSSN